MLVHKVLNKIEKKNPNLKDDLNWRVLKYIVSQAPIHFTLLMMDLTDEEISALKEGKELQGVRES